MTSPDNLTTKVVIDFFNKSSKAQDSEEHPYLVTTSTKFAARPGPNSTLSNAFSFKHVYTAHLSDSKANAPNASTTKNENK